ncbi:outer membrane protein assembly factor BamB family protein [Halorussus litoreus]|uniref:outer membrane protein assembly factor BamB family protein n=1 Tax=Halorussus litoreus TaxID=1710536 RepID=UPI000E2652FC|nr:PQQ-binding-like beta-propeller repeat protein [Halorussus litoreus]
MIGSDDSKLVTRRRFVAAASGLSLVGLGVTVDNVPAPKAETNWTTDEGSRRPVVLRMKDDQTLYLATENALVAKSSEDGSEKWRFTEIGDYPFVAPRHVGDDSLLVPGEKRICCVDTTTGSQQWQFELTKSDTRVQPWLFDGRAYVADDALHVLSAETGTVEWTFAPPTPISETLPTDESVYVGTNEGTVSALSVDTGDEQWRFTASGPLGRSYAALTSIDVSSPDDSTGGDQFESIYAWARGDNRLYSISRSDGTERWQFTSDSGHVVFPGVATTERVYLVDGSEYLALSPVDGSVEWTFDADESLKWFSSVEDGTAYVHTDSELHAIETSDGTRRWRFELDSSQAPVVPDAGVRRMRGDDPVTSVVALDSQSGSVRWTLDAPEQFESALVGTDDVYLGTTTGTVSSVAGPNSLAATIRRAVR